MPRRSILAPAAAALALIGTGAISSRAAQRSAIRFEDRAAAAGLVFRHDNGMQGEKHIVEVMGSGAALFDCDGDGDLDALLRQGGPVDGSGKATDRLFRNDSGGSGLRFTDVTPGSGLDRPAIGMGVAAGDYDNDGRVDLYLTNYGPNRLLRNRGGCRFEDVTAAAGAGDDRWSVPATFFDYDRDGWLDLFVGNYVDFDPARPVRCRSASSMLDFCGPDSFAPLPDRLFHNEKGRFRDVTAASGLAAGGKALGAIAFDADGDGWSDLFVGNDATDNNLWVNRRDGSFVDEGLARGCALNARGGRTGDMGVDAADFDGDGDDDLISTHIATEGVSLWTGDATGGFRDRAAPSGLLLPTLPHTGFGTAWFDADGDGRLDLYFANGAVRVLENLLAEDDPLPLWEENQLFRNVGGGRFRDVTSSAGKDAAGTEVSRGVAFGDVDDDGDVDLLINNNGGAPRLLVNRTEPRSGWVGFRLLGGDPLRDRLGAVVTLELADGTKAKRRARADGSYGSANDPRVIFGLGGGPSKIRSVTVDWPSGRRESFPPPATGAYADLIEGSGRPARAEP